MPHVDSLDWKVCWCEAFTILIMARVLLCSQMKDKRWNLDLTDEMWDTVDYSQLHHT